MHPVKVDLTEFLVKDEFYNWEFVSPLVKRQNRSKSLDMTIPYEMGEDEYILSKQASETNPYI